MGTLATVLLDKRIETRRLFFPHVCIIVKEIIFSHTTMLDFFSSSIKSKFIQYRCHNNFYFSLNPNAIVFFFFFLQKGKITLNYYINPNLQPNCINPPCIWPLPRKLVCQNGENLLLQLPDHKRTSKIHVIVPWSEQGEMQRYKEIAE